MDGFTNTYNNIKTILDNARKNVYYAVNFEMVQAYWSIGRVIVEEEQKGKNRADYGKYLIRELSRRLTNEYGRGFDERNLWYMKAFYLNFPKLNSLRSELTWTHYRLLLRVENQSTRDFYMIESINNKWSTRELERQINSLLYERLALSRDKKKVIELSKKGQIIEKPSDIIKDPYILEFLGLNDKFSYKEKDLEKALLDKLQAFILELGKGFSLVSRQYRINVDNEHYYVDLVFYNYLLKCFFLVELKSGKLNHTDIGQMDFYVRYFEKEVKKINDNPTIGLILCTGKNEVMARYTLLNDKRNVFASKYRLYLPSEEEIRKGLESVKEKI